jgi:hypothetical protein
MLTDEQLDRLIGDAMKKMVDSSETPDPDLKETWKQVQKKLRQKRLQILTVRSLSVVTLLLLCFGALTAVAPQPVRAVGARIWSGFTTIMQGNSSATIQYGLKDNPGPHTPPPPSAQTIVPEEGSLPGLAARCSFPVLAPQYLPPGYKVSKATYYPIGQSGGNLQIQYTSGLHSLIFVQNCAAVQGLGYGYDTDDTTVSDITVRGRPGKQFYTPGKGFTQWIWTEGDISYRISGTVTPVEMRQIVSSMKVVNP